jgi:beta-glucanase (GH16 family)
MKHDFFLYMLFIIFIMGCNKEEINGQNIDFNIEITPSGFNLEGKDTVVVVKVKSDTGWAVSADKDWCVLSPATGYIGETVLKMSVKTNNSGNKRTSELVFMSGTSEKKYTISQNSVQYVPAGYSLVWQDEFDSSGKPVLPNTSKWWFETGDHGWGNNELQNYIAGINERDTSAVVSGGVLKIIANKVGNKVISARINTSESWEYGYFEARLKLPEGKGTWPAFWMLPKEFNTWPGDGEIDIMEEVGYRPNWISAAIHCNAYNHSISTEKSAERFISTSQNEFNIYALEWTEDCIKGYVNGENYFTFVNDKKGNNDTWPFNKPFYIKLNLAWGGN